MQNIYQCFIASVNFLHIWYLIKFSLHHNLINSSHIYDIESSLQYAEHAVIIFYMKISCCAYPLETNRSLKILRYTSIVKFSSAIVIEKVWVELGIISQSLQNTHRNVKNIDIIWELLTQWKCIMYKQEQGWASCQKQPIIENGGFLSTDDLPRRDGNVISGNTMTTQKVDM